MLEALKDDTDKDRKMMYEQNETLNKKKKIPRKGEGGRVEREKGREGKKEGRKGERREGRDKEVRGRAWRNCLQERRPPLKAPIHPPTQALPQGAQAKPTLVLATPISGPALMWTPQSVSREMELPTVLVTPTVRARRSLQ
jgi:hypothetical protein